MMQDFAKQGNTSASSSKDMDISNADITEMYKINPMLSMIPQAKLMDISMIAIMLIIRL